MAPDRLSLRRFIHVRLKPVCSKPVLFETGFVRHRCWLKPVVVEAGVVVETSLEFFETAFDFFDTKHAPRCTDHFGTWESL